MWHQAITQAYSNNLTIADKIDWSFYTKKVPPGTEKDSLDAYERLRKLRDQGIQ